MTKVLVIFAHPALDRSRVHRHLLERIPDRVTLHRLYAAYPRFDVDVAREQELLLQHDVIVLQHPLYWYSVPPLLKQWIDAVLEHGWAYGIGGTALVGKAVLNATSAGGRRSSYRRQGPNRFPLEELLRPVEQTFRLCGMEYLPPFVMYGSLEMTDEEIQAAGERYRKLLELLRDQGPAGWLVEVAREENGSESAEEEDEEGESSSTG